jgi:hypothetical protein
LDFGFWKPKTKILFFWLPKSKSQKSTYLGVFFGFCQSQKAKKSHNKRALSQAGGTVRPELIKPPPSFFSTRPSPPLPINIFFKAD